MLDISDLLDYLQGDCVIDIFDVITGETIAEGLEKDDAQDWHEKHSYDVCSFEPIQRKDDDGDVVFGIVFNVENVEEDK